MDKWLCPVCKKMQWTYRLATAEDQHGAMQKPTGPLHIVAHNCAGDHRQIEGQSFEPNGDRNDRT